MNLKVCVPFNFKPCWFTLPIGFSGGNTSCVPRSRNCISCVPRCPLHVYQLRPALSTPKHDELRPAVSKKLHQLHRKIGMYKYPTIGRFLQFYCSLLYTQLYAHTELLNDIDNTVVISYYCLMFKPYWKNLYEEEDRHIIYLISPISSYCYNLIKTLSTERVLMQ